MDDDPDGFAARLRHGIREQGQSLESLQRRLERRGLRVARSTLSYWQRGERRPQSPTSLDIVAAIESILGLAPGHLTDALPTPPSATRPTAGAVAIGGTRLRASLRAVGCDDVIHDSAPIAIIDRLHLGPQGGIDTVESIITIKALDTVGRVPAVSWSQPGGSPEHLEHIALSGCRVGRVTRDVAANLIVSELILDRQLQRGESHVVRLEVRDANALPSCGWSVLLLRDAVLVAVEATFHPHCLPVVIEAYERVSERSPDRATKPLSLSPEGWVASVRDNAPRGVFGLRWHFAGGPTPP